MFLKRLSEGFFLGELRRPVRPTTGQAKDAVPEAKSPDTPGALARRLVRTDCWDIVWNERLQARLNWQLCGLESACGWTGKASVREHEGSSAARVGSSAVHRATHVSADAVAYL